jgi:hypothetical protein
MASKGGIATGQGIVIVDAMERPAKPATASGIGVAPFKSFAPVPRITKYLKDHI